MADSCGNRCMSRSACVPLPTPGAPTRITRAARLRRLVLLMFGSADEAIAKELIFASLCTSELVG